MVPECCVDLRRGVGGAGGARVNPDEAVFGVEIEAVKYAWDDRSYCGSDWQVDGEAVA